MIMAHWMKLWGKVKTGLKLQSMTTNCIQYGVWHITNNSSDATQPKESMKRPWLHSFYCGFWHRACSILLLSNSKCLNVSLLAGLYLSCKSQGSLFFFFYQPLYDSKAAFKSIQMLNAGIFLPFLFSIGGKIKKVNAQMKHLTSTCYQPEQRSSSKGTNKIVESFLYIFCVGER